MYGRNSSCCIRIPFTVSGDPATINIMTLKVRYDDGFVAYLNGVEIGRALFLGEPTWNSAASGNHDDFEAVLLSELNVSAQAGLLKQGQNLLAIQAMNASTTSSDFLISVELVAGRSTLPGGNAMSDAVHVYTGPIAITESTQIKARVLVAEQSVQSRGAAWRRPSSTSGRGPRAFESMRSCTTRPIRRMPSTSNCSTSAIRPITLYDAIRGVPWRFCDNPDDPAIDVLFPADPPVTLAPGECLLLVKDLAAFQAAYTAPAGVQILEWGKGRLSNSGDTIQISSPGDENFDGTRSWIPADRVTYSDGSHPENFATGVDPWPTEADGKGMALSRIDPEADGNDPANWQAGPSIARRREVTVSIQPPTRRSLLVVRRPR